MPTEDQKNRLANVVAWVRTAKENLPDFNDGVVAADRIAQVSALLDRMHIVAVALREEAASDTGVEPRRHAA